MSHHRRRQTRQQLLRPKPPTQKLPAAIAGVDVVDVRYVKERSRTGTFFKAPTGYAFRLRSSLRKENISRRILRITEGELSVETPRVRGK